MLSREKKENMSYIRQNRPTPATIAVSTRSSSALKSSVKEISSIAPVFKGNLLDDQERRQIVQNFLNPAMGDICVRCTAAKLEGQQFCEKCMFLCPDWWDCRGNGRKDPKYSQCSDCWRKFLKPKIYYPARHRGRWDGPSYRIGGTVHLYWGDNECIGISRKPDKRQRQRGCLFRAILYKTPHFLEGWLAEATLKWLRHNADKSEILRDRYTFIVCATLTHKVEFTASPSVVSGEHHILLEISRSHAEIGGLSREQVVPLERFEIKQPGRNDWDPAPYFSGEKAHVRIFADAAIGTWEARAVTAQGSVGPVTELVIPSGVRDAA